MKKNVQSILSFAMILWCALSLNAQFSYEGAKDYGRIIDMTYDPTIENKVYATTFGNHLLASEDNGENWDVIYSSPSSSSSIKELRFYNDTTLSFYVMNSGSAELNTVYLFDTEINTISKQYTPPTTVDADKEWVNAYSIYEGDSNIILFNQDFKIGFASFSHVYYSTDGGDSWESVYFNGDFDSVFPNNVFISPNDPTKFFITRSNGPTSIDGGLLVSTDEGATWEDKIPGHLFNEMTFHPDNADVILAGTFGGVEDQNLYKSEDGGDTWNIVPINWDTYFLDSITHIEYNPNDPDNIMILEGNEIVITTDGGLTWENHIYDSWELTYFYGIHASFNPFQDGEILISCDYYPLRSLDGGATVNQVENSFFPGTYASVNTEGDQHLFYSVQRGIVHKNLTTEEETNYFVEPIGNFYNSDPPKFITNRNLEGRLFMFTDGFTGQRLWVSNDYGASINTLKSTWFDRLLNVTQDPSNENKIWVSFENGGTSIIDFTDVWSPISQNISLPTSNLHRSTFIDPEISNDVLVGLGGAIYRTLDNGSTWTNVSVGLTLDPYTDYVYQIKQNPNNSDEYIIATTQGIFQSVDNLQSWSQIYVGTNVRSIEYSNVTEGHIAASIPSSLSSTTTLIFSVDNGAEWNTITSENFYHAGSDSMDFIFEEESLTAYISTFDLGVISYTIDLSLYIAPPNDECVDAIALNCGDTVVGQTISANDSGNNESADVWYSYTGQGTTEAVTLSLCDGGTDFDSVIRIFDACDGEEIAFNDDFCGTQSEVTFISDGISTYNVMVEGYNTATGNYSLNVSCEEIIIPDNDLCENATAIECGDSVTGDTTYASNVGNPGECDTDLSVGPGVWYSITIPNDGDYEVNVNTIDSEFDTKLGVFSGVCGETICVAGNDDIGGGVLQSEVIFEATAGETYNIYVTGFLTNAGIYNLNVECELLLGTESNVIEGFTYYPNPSSNVVNLIAQDQIENVTLFNILGQKVINQSVNALNTQINLSNLVSGTYLMQVVVNGKVGTYKLIKE